MSDFIIQIGELSDPQDIANRLQQRPGMGHRPAQVWYFDWGSAVIQPPPGQGYQPHEKNNTVYACTGRPRLTGFVHEGNGAEGFCRKLAQAWEENEFDALLESATGMFLFAVIGRTGFHIATDLLGSQPVYLAQHNSRPGVCVGTNADIVADITGNSGDLDLTSLCEFFVYDQITFPYTTYSQVKERGPAAIHSWWLDKGEIRSSSRIYWSPNEPKFWPSSIQATSDLEHAIRAAAHEILRGTEHLAITLSGGRDSRTVMAVLKPYGIDAALTYCTRENRETSTAALVAEAAGVPHKLVRRDPHFYGTLLDRTMKLIGSEVRAVAHGFAIVDAGLANSYDVIVGGYLSDTLLKDHFMPRAQREQLRHKSIRERLQHLVFPSTVTNAVDWRWASSLNLLNPQIKEEVEQRRRERLAEIVKIRPETAAEWQGFWPISRQHDVGSAWGNSRLFCTDELFYFREVIEVATRLSIKDRYVGTVAHNAFNMLCGPLNELTNANTGLAASADDQREGRYFKRLKRAGQLNDFYHLAASETPWNDVQNSWADSSMLLMHSPDWRRHRSEILNSSALEILNSVLSPQGQTQLRHFTSEDDARVNMAMIQMGLHINRGITSRK